jgi:hypothetical protein
MTNKKQPIPGLAVSAHIVTPVKIPQFSYNCAAVLDADSVTITPSGIGSSTQPASDFEAGRIVWQSQGFSLMKLFPVAVRDQTSTITGLKMRVYGWSRDQSFTSSGAVSVSNRLWWPNMLFAADLVRGASGWTPWNNTDQFNNPWGAMSTITKTFGDGKIFNAPTDAHGGATVVIDTLGCQYIDVRFFCTSYTGTPYANVIWQSL